MALARCAECGRSTKNVSPRGYAAQPHPPVNHPDSGLVCGTVGCERAALIWLKLDEEKAYQQGIGCLSSQPTQLRLDFSELGR